jgi:hypothetical protein
LKQTTNYKISSARNKNNLIEGIKITTCSTRFKLLSKDKHMWLKFKKAVSIIAACHWMLITQVSVDLLYSEKLISKFASVSIEVHSA